MFHFMKSRKICPQLLIAPQNMILAPPYWSLGAAKSYASPFSNNLANNFQFCRYNSNDFSSVHTTLNHLWDHRPSWAFIQSTLICLFFVEISIFRGTFWVLKLALIMCFVWSYDNSWPSRFISWYIALELLNLFWSYY